MGGGGATTAPDEANTTIISLVFTLSTDLSKLGLSLRRWLSLLSSRSGRRSLGRLSEVTALHEVELMFYCH